MYVEHTIDKPDMVNKVILWHDYDEKLLINGDYGLNSNDDEVEIGIDSVNIDEVEAGSDHFNDDEVEVGGDDVNEDELKKEVIMLFMKYKKEVRMLMMKYRKKVMLMKKNKKEMIMMKHKLKVIIKRNLKMMMLTMLEVTLIDNFSDNEYECNEASIELDLTIILPCNEKVSHYDVYDKKICDNDDCFMILINCIHLLKMEMIRSIRIFQLIKLVRFKFKLGMVFNNKDVVREALNEYSIYMKENILIKKSDGKRVVINCMEDCKSYMKISKRDENQFWQVVSIFDEHTCHRITHNK